MALSGSSTSFLNMVKREHDDAEYLPPAKHSCLSDDDDGVPSSSSSAFVNMVKRDGETTENPAKHSCLSDDDNTDENTMDISAFLKPLAKVQTDIPLKRDEEIVRMSCMSQWLTLSANKSIRVILDKYDNVVVEFGNHKKPGGILLQTYAWEALCAVIPNITQYFDNDAEVVKDTMVDPMTNTIVSVGKYNNIKVVDIRERDSNGFRTKTGITLNKTSWSCLVSLVGSTNNYIVKLSDCKDFLLISGYKEIADMLSDEDSGLDDWKNSCSNSLYGPIGESGVPISWSDYFFNKVSLLVSNIDRDKYIAELEKINTTAFTGGAILDHVLKNANLLAPFYVNAVQDKLYWNDKSVFALIP